MLPLPEYSRFAISLLAVLSPFAAVPAFLSHTRGLASRQTSHTAIIAACTAAVVLVAASDTRGNNAGTGAADTGIAGKGRRPEAIHAGELSPLRPSLESRCTHNFAHSARHANYSYLWSGSIIRIGPAVIRARTANCPRC